MGKDRHWKNFWKNMIHIDIKNPCCTTDTVVFSYKDEQALKEGRLKDTFG